jgi:hypothetical protein
MEWHWHNGNNQIIKSLKIQPYNLYNDAIAYLTFGLRARDFYGVVVDEGEARISPNKNWERVI